MGKKLKQQRRGKGSNAYTKLPNTFNIEVNYTKHRDSELNGEVVDIINNTGHSAPVMSILYENFSKSHMIAPEGIKIGSQIGIGNSVSYSIGNVLPLSNIPEGIAVYNIESKPGDGGKYVRSAGSFARVSRKTKSTVSVVLPSKKIINLSMECRAQLGVVAGGGIKTLPIMKAGKSHYMNHALNKLWPKNRGVKMNATDHPYGGKNHHKGKSSSTSRNAPPGRKVGHIASKRTGRRKR